MQAWLLSWYSYSAEYLSHAKVLVKLKGTYQPTEKSTSYTALHLVPSLNCACAFPRLLVSILLSLKHDYVSNQNYRGREDLEESHECLILHVRTGTNPAGTRNESCRNEERILQHNLSCTSKGLVCGKPSQIPHAERQGEDHSIPNMAQWRPCYKCMHKCGFFISEDCYKCGFFVSEDLAGKWRFRYTCEVLSSHSSQSFPVTPGVFM